MKKLFILFVPYLFWSCTDESPSGIIELSDIHIVSIGLTNIVAEASITIPGGLPIKERGFCWSTTSTPSIDSADFLISGQDTNDYTDTIKRLTYNTKYYVRAFAKNAHGVFYSKTDSVNTSKSLYSMGQSYQGGHVFYIDSTGEHGLIACKIIGHLPWANWWTRFEFLGTDVRIGSGQTNTIMLIDKAGDDAYAAKFCDDLVYEGYGDWFFPSRDELSSLKVNLGPTGILNAYSGDIYWSSSEVSFPNYQYAAWIETINGLASFTSDDKQYDHGIIPVRKF